jgi:NTP pyrophosphatase (non-canonical NTP hydrolase)
MRHVVGPKFLAKRARLGQRDAAMSDTIQELTAEIRAFRDARDWQQFHAPKELAVAIAAEAGELLQHFVWQTPAQSEQRACERVEELAGEIADVSILLFELADTLGLDLTEAMRRKLTQNALRYPVEKARGSNKKYTEL